jgi:hypothetical protein
VQRTSHGQRQSARPAQAVTGAARGRVTRSGRCPDGPPSPGVGHQACERARLAGSRRPGPGRAATRRGDLSRTISRHPPLPAIAPGEATRADFQRNANISPERTTGPEPHQPVRAAALSGTAGDGASRPPGGKRSAQRPRRDGVTGLKPAGSRNVFTQAIRKLAPQPSIRFFKQAIV